MRSKLVGTGEVRTGERTREIKDDVEIAFVIFPDSIVGWTEFADEL